MTLPMKKFTGNNSIKKVLVIRFKEKYPSAKVPVGLHDIIFVYSRHVECVVLITKTKWFRF